MQGGLFCVFSFPNLFLKNFEFVTIASLTIIPMCTSINPPFGNNVSPNLAPIIYRIYLFSFVFTYFYLLESLICGNLFLFMTTCKNLFCLWLSAKIGFTYFHLSESLFVYDHLLESSLFFVRIFFLKSWWK